VQRWLFNFAAMLSMVLCGACVALWGRGLNTASSVTWSLRKGNFGIVHVLNSFGGRIKYQRFSYYYQPERIYTHVVKDEPITLEERTFPAELARILYDDSTLYAKTYEGEDGDSRCEVSLPNWMLVVLTSPLPAAWMISWWRKRMAAMRTARGLCPRCGYDLRATPDQCPECGAVKQA
jgi:hypothetical protein